MARGKFWAAAALSVVLMAQPAAAGWKLVPAKAATNSVGIGVTPQTDWNLATGKIGPQATGWTHDGFELNALQFFGGVPAGGTLYKERDKKRNPHPKFDKDALLPDLVDLFERSFRVEYNVSDFKLIEVKPAELAGRKAIRARYTYTLPNDDLVRVGEVRLTTNKSKLYAINFFAPSLHYFDAGLPEALAIMDGAKF